MDVVDIIVQAMKEQGTTITHVANKTNMKVDALSKCLLRTRKIKADEFIGIAKVLRLDVNRFIGVGDDKAS